MSSIPNRNTFLENPRGSEKSLFSQMERAKCDRCWWDDPPCRASSAPYRESSCARLPQQESQAEPELGVQEFVDAYLFQRKLRSGCPDQHRHPDATWLDAPRAKRAGRHRLRVQRQCDYRWLERPEGRRRGLQPRCGEFRLLKALGRLPSRECACVHLGNGHTVCQ